MREKKTNLASLKAKAKPQSYGIQSFEFNIVPDEICPPIVELAGFRDDGQTEEASCNTSHLWVETCVVSPPGQWRSWPGGSRGPDPPEPPGIVHANRANPMRIFSGRGGRGVVCVSNMLNVPVLSSRQ